MNTTSNCRLAIVGRSPEGRPRTFRLEPLPTSRGAAYRRLAAVVLRLDVASLGSELRAARLAVKVPRAA